MIYEDELQKIEEMSLEKKRKKRSFTKDFTQLWSWKKSCIVRFHNQRKSALSKAKLEASDLVSSGFLASQLPASYFCKAGIMLLF